MSSTPKGPFYEYDTSKLESSLCIPSSIHGYSLGVEYVRDWFIDHIPNYFKTIHVNGRHIFQDHKRFARGERIDKNIVVKPAVAFTPSINLEHDRGTQDMYFLQKNQWINKFNHNKDFFQDYENNIFLGMNLRELEIGFNIRTRVSTFAQQVDLYRNMELSFRIGFTETNYISADFHIPMELILNIANHAGFEIKNSNIVELDDFMLYLNTHSGMPIVYKLRAMNGNNEFFMRVPNLYTHINIMDKLRDDQGEREGHLDNNFHIDMNLVLRLNIPHFYVYRSGKRVYKDIPRSEGDARIGLYTFKVFDIPDMNENKWKKYVETAYDFDPEDMEKTDININIKPIIQKDLMNAIEDAKSVGISPETFIDLKLYNFDENSLCSFSWETFNLTIPKALSLRIHIVLYVDNVFLSEYKLKSNKNKVVG